jgi:AGZA family xanthine/uracil permease-like MFS transporter
MLERLFQLKANKTTRKREIMAGITTFMTMAYILAVNPHILSQTGMDAGSIFVVTAIASAAATIVMALAANLPFALAPGMGLNAFFAFTVVLQMKHSWQFALTAVLIEGLIFILLTVFNVREKIIKAIPQNVGSAIAAGIGLFIAFIGLKNAGVIVSDQATFVTLGNVTSPTVILAFVGILIIAVLLSLKVKGAILYGLILTTLIGFPLGVTHLPENFDFSIPSIEPTFWQFEWGWLDSKEGILEMITVVATFLFCDLFDTVGTLLGVSIKSGLITEKGEIPRVKQALFADSIGTTLGAILGTSTVSTYVESASGVAEGGRTGLTSLTTGVLFIVAILFAPIFLMIPAAATAPALCIVGLMMLQTIRNIDLEDYTEAVPAFITILAIPFATSISEGIYLGIIFYVLLKICTGKWKDITWFTLLLAILFIALYILR